MLLAIVRFAFVCVLACGTPYGAESSVGGSVAEQDETAETDEPKDGDEVPPSPSPIPPGDDGDGESEQTDPPPPPPEDSGGEQPKPSDGGEGANGNDSDPPAIPPIAPPAEGDNDSERTPSETGEIDKLLSEICGRLPGLCEGFGLALLGGILAVTFSGLLHQAVLGLRQNRTLAGWVFLLIGGAVYLLLPFLAQGLLFWKQLLYSIISALILAGVFTFWWNAILSRLKTGIKIFLVALVPCLVLVASDGTEPGNALREKIIWVPIIVAIGFELWWNLTKRKRKGGSGSKPAASGPMGSASSGGSGQAQEEDGHENT